MVICIKKYEVFKYIFTFTLLTTITFYEYLQQLTLVIIDMNNYQKGLVHNYLLDEECDRI